MKPTVAEECPVVNLHKKRYDIFMSHTISKDDVAHVAHLAHIHLTPAEVEKFTGELSHILEYVQQLQSVDTRGVEPSAHPMRSLSNSNGAGAIGNANVLRDDVVERQAPEVRDALLAAVPTREGDHVKVKAVFQ